MQKLEKLLDIIPERLKQDEAPVSAGVGVEIESAEDLRRPVW